eukprot:CFRG1147T1
MSSQVHCADQYGTTMADLDTKHIAPGSNRISNVKANLLKDKSLSPRSSEVQRPSRRVGGVTTAIRKFEQDSSTDNGLANSGKRDGKTRAEKKFVNNVIGGEHTAVVSALQKDSTLVHTSEVITQLPVLHLAVCKKDEVMIMELVEQGYSLEAKSCSSGDTALHLAARLGDDNLIQLLIKAGSSVDAPNFDGLTYEDLLTNDEWTSPPPKRVSVENPGLSDESEARALLKSADKKGLQGQTKKKGFFKILSTKVGGSS